MGLDGRDFFAGLGERDDLRGLGGCDRRTGLGERAPLVGLGDRASTSSADGLNGLSFFISSPKSTEDKE